MSCFAIVVFETTRFLFYSFYPKKRFPVQLQMKGIKVLIIMNVNPRDNMYIGFTKFLTFNKPIVRFVKEAEMLSISQINEFLSYDRHMENLVSLRNRLIFIVASR